MRRGGGRTGELGDSLGRGPQAGATRDHAAADCDVTGDVGGRSVTFGVEVGLPRKLLAPGHTLRVRRGDGIGHQLQPHLELVVAARADLDTVRNDHVVVVGEGEAEHVLERLEPVATIGEHGCDVRVGQVWEFDLHGRVDGRIGALDLVELSRGRHSAEADPDHLVVRRVVVGEARQPAGYGDDKTSSVRLASMRGQGRGFDELSLDALDSRGQVGIAEQRQTSVAHDCRGSLSRPPFAATLRVRPVRANFVAQYAPALAQPRRAATEEMLMIVPPPARRICGHTALASKNGAVKFTAMTRSQPCRSRASTGPGTSVAAAFTSTSIRRNSAATLETTASIAAASARSVGNARAVPPSSAIAV